MGREEQFLLWTVHSIVFDRDSTAILAGELAHLGDVLSAGRSLPLAESRVSYAAAIYRQRERLDSESMQAQLAYWRRQLSGNLPLLELPGDHPRPAAQTHLSARHEFILSASLQKRLQVLSRRQGVNLFTTLLAAFQTLLHRYTGLDDLLIGTPAPQRGESGWEGLIGPWSNTLVLRTDLSGDPSFTELLCRGREVVREACAHQEVPFERLVDVLQPVRDRSRSPVIQVMFHLDEQPSLRWELSRVTLEVVEVVTGTTGFDLTLQLTPSADGLAGWFEYAVDLFDAPTIARMAAQYETLLEGVTAHPDQRLWDLPLLPDEERQRVVVEWNATHADYPHQTCFHQLFEQQAARTPQAIAVTFELQSLTYAQLNARANQLAHHLLRVGIGPEVRVGMCVERSLEMLIALLAIMKAGGTYVPLDPAFPRERLAFVLQDAQAPLLLTQRQLLDRLPQDETKCLLLDVGQDRFASESSADLPTYPDPQQLAYVLYTSGSTGKPKGVGIPHCALVNFLTSMRDALGLDPTDRLLAVTTLAFDIAGLELFLPLLVGSRVELARRDVAVDPGLLAERLGGGATVMQATPATWRLLLEAGWEGQPQLTALCGGEALPTDLAARLRARCGTLWNLYGPTETTIWSTLQRVEQTDGEAIVPIGRPIANTRLYLLDRGLQPVPIGVPGELYIGGEGLARGYLNRPALTAEKFVPDPFSAEPGARLYRTGDLARYLPDGTIEFLGRLDHQVKVRGFRIELGEIEAALLRHPAVRAAVVVAREEGAGEKRLVGYVVPAGEVAPESRELRAWLQQQLPEYMIPALFVPLAALPLTPNGKVDRSALPAPEERSPEKLFIAPEDALERQLAQICEEILNVRPVGLSDNFFDLGGHSLLAVRLFARIEQIWEQTLPLATLFQAPTVGQLASLLRDSGWSPPWSCLVPIRPTGTRPPFFCMHGAGAHILYLHILARYLPPDQPFYGIQSLGLDGKQAPHTRIEDMAAHYITEIRTVQPSGPYYLGGYSFGGVVAFEMAQQLLAQGEEAALVAMFNSGFRLPRYISEVSTFRARVYPLVENAELRWDQIREARQHHADMVRRLGRAAYLRKEAGVAGRLVLRTMGSLGRKMTGRSQSVLPSEDALPPATLHVWHTNINAERAYVPKVYPGRVTLFWASEAPVTDHDWYSPLGWNEYAGDGLEVHVIPGNHESFRTEPHVQVLAAKLMACLDRAQAAAARR
jgi:amino acid adenylation domain-containing protein